MCVCVYVCSWFSELVVLLAALGESSGEAEGAVYMLDYDRRRVLGGERG